MVGCGPLVRLGEVGSSLETQSNLILMTTLLTVVCKSLSPCSSHNCPYPRSSKSLLLSWAAFRAEMQGGEYVLSRSSPWQLRLKWYNFPFSIHRRPFLFLSFTETFATRLDFLSKLFYDHHEYFSSHIDNLSKLTLPISGPCSQPHHSFLGLSDLERFLQSTLKHPVSLASFSTLLVHLTITIIIIIFRVEQRTLIGIYWISFP